MAAQDFRAELDRLDGLREKAVAQRDLAFETVVDPETRREVAEAWADAFTELAGSYERLALALRDELLARGGHDPALMELGRTCMARIGELAAPVTMQPREVVHVEPTTEELAEFEAMPAADLPPIDVDAMIDEEIRWQHERVEAGEVPPLAELTPAGVDAVKRRWPIRGPLSIKTLHDAMRRESRARAPRRVYDRTRRARAPRRRLRARTGSSTSRGDPPQPGDDDEPPRRDLLRLAAPWICCAGLIDAIGCLLWRWLR